MKIDILTLFPDFFINPLNESIVGRAIDKGKIEVETINIRNYALNKHRQVDDYPYGGGSGMVLKADVLISAINDIKKVNSWVIYMSPQGKVLNQKKVKELSEKSHLVVLCGHYEGVDERALTEVDEEISIGDYVLTGGELPALVLTDAVTRLIPGVLGDDNSAIDESFTDYLLEYPHYTRPAEFNGLKVPDILLSGHHENIRLFRKKQSLLRTLIKRPDLLLSKEFDEEEEKILKEILFDREYS
ncbi:tRNA (guanine(37)-N(1))-methyltransferase [Candidatus Syntrophocurvum alkaliphilum]|uniref:tRNA (guanine-N(1)-)-methyltransferase n=1 Tax=Candidatus Syntrophocurvum alkaliphilum TaxID=2293317 RepID=A0A6I6DI27_9FIRM|nr:tRNA (guanosine(37)-N1)-methyltransferase TrmD [Candidatus Syntrophocurvum alkaliphilum]QGT99960.1 tRNA (guanine(37)-N(1))-methyltransferase [Candidatus Syntrophocurvum alkaliphilum]